jgi:hypothetical protein
MTNSASTEDWESQALFPARLLVGLPPEAQRKLLRAGTRLYAVMMEDFEPDCAQGGPTLALELRALVEELWILHHTARTIRGLEAVSTALEQILLQTAEELAMPGSAAAELATGQAAPSMPPIRPFLLILKRQPEHREILTDLGDGLAALPRKATPPQWRRALAIDLRWVRTVLERYIAIRGELSELRPGDTALCGLAARLAQALAHPIALVQAASNTPARRE